ncbi:glycosyltransferase [Azospirillum sp. sgz302134]
MRCTILALGSRGDVQPLIALGVGLKAAGFDVRCAAPADFEGTVRQYGLDYFRLTGNASAFFGGQAGIALRERTRDKREFVRFFDDYLGTFLDKLMAACWEACQDSDAILCWPWTRVGPSLGERLGIPVFVVSVNPVLHLPTSAFANPFQGPEELEYLPLGPLYNRLSWLWARPFTRIGQKQVDRWRQTTLGLPTIRWQDELRALRRLPHLFGYSPAVLPKPWDWGRHIHVTGYWFQDRPSGFTPPADLVEFLEAGEPPVAIGFSSQVGRNARRITADVVEGLERSGRRGIMIAGWGGLKGVELPSSIFRVDSIPYDWLFPRVAAMVHHGGSGSAAAALRAGVPSFAIPFGYEQGLWGRQIAKLGVGVDPLPPSQLTPRRFCDAVRRVTEDAGIRRRATALGLTIMAEDGIGEAVRIVERTLTSRSSKPVTTLRPAFARE